MVDPEGPTAKLSSVPRVGISYMAKVGPDQKGGGRNDLLLFLIGRGSFEGRSEYGYLWISFGPWVRREVYRTSVVLNIGVFEGDIFV